MNSRLEGNKQTGYNFLLKHREAVRQYQREGLTKRNEGYRNVSLHQATAALVVYELSELIGVAEDQRDFAVDKALVHDIDKKRRQRQFTPIEIADQEAAKTGLDAATGSNFEEYPLWGIVGDLLRYADSSSGMKDNGVAIVPWRERVRDFQISDNKAKIYEGEKKRTIYGMSAWERLEQIMIEIEGKFYKMAIDKNPALAKKYPDQTCLTQMVIDRINE